MTNSFSILRFDRVSAFSQHNPIVIDGDVGFTSANGVIGGSGSAADPYIIGGWDTSSISIAHTTSNFVIYNTWVHLGTGISFQNVQHGTVEGSVIGANTVGLSVFASAYDTFQSNTFVGNNVEIDQSFFQTLEANNFQSGAGVLITGNIITEFDTHIITPDNLVSGYPLYYYRDCHGLNIDSRLAPWNAGAGELIIANCNDIRVAGLQLTSGPGTQLDFLTNSQITSNIMVTGLFGVSLYHSSGNEISQNTVHGTNYGFTLEGSSGNSFSGNAVYGISNNGFTLDASSQNAFSTNTEYGGTDGFSLQASSGNTFTANVAYSNNGNGFTIQTGSTQNTFLLNTVYSCQNFGFYVGMSSGNRITRNNVHNNGVDGFYSLGSGENTFTDDVAAYNGNDGFDFLGGTSNNVLTGNIVDHNNGDGFYFDSPVNNTLTLNRASYNAHNGFHLSSAIQNTLLYNSAYFNVENGFSMDITSSKNLLAYNIAYNQTLLGGGFDFLGASRDAVLFNLAYNNSVGYTITTSSGNIIGYNTAGTNSGGGFSLSSSDHNLLAKNISYGSNAGPGFLADSSGENEFAYNTVFKNTDGFFISFSDNCLLIGNTVYNNTVPNITNTNAGALVQGSSNLNITLNKFYNNPVGVYFQYALSGNELVYNNFFNNPENAHDTDQVDSWNTSRILGLNIIGGPYLGGNFWGDYNGTDLNGDGIGDTLLPYNSYFQLYPGRGILVGGDYGPLVFPSTGPTPNFVLFTTPVTLTLNELPFAHQMIAIKSQNFAGNVQLSATISPSLTGAPSLNLEHSTIYLTVNMTATITLTIDGLHAQPGVYTITITSTGGSITHTSQIQVTVQGYRVTNQPTTLTMTAGQSLNYTLSLVAQQGFGDDVMIYANAPGGPNITFQPAFVSLAQGTGSAVMMVSTLPDLAAGNYTVELVLSSGQLLVIDSLTLMVKADLQLESRPRFVEIPVGSSGVVAQIAESLGFTGTVNLAATTSSSFLGASLSSQTITLFPGKIITSDLTINVSPLAAQSQYSVNVTAQSGSLLRFSVVNIKVVPPANFLITTATKSPTLRQGGTASFSLLLNSTNGFSGTVKLSASSLTPVQGLSFAFSPSNVPLVSGGSASTMVTISSKTTTPSGQYTIKVTGSAGSLANSVSLSLTIVGLGGGKNGDFRLSVTPSNLTVVQGGMESFDVTLSGTNGFEGNVTLSATSPTGLTASFSSTNIRVSSGNMTASLTIYAAVTVPLGNYDITVEGSNGTLTHQSTVTVSISQAPTNPNLPNPSTIAGIPAAEFYPIVGGTLIASVSAVLLLKLRPKHKLGT